MQDYLAKLVSTMKGDYKMNNCEDCVFRYVCEAEYNEDGSSCCGLLIIGLPYSL